MIDTYLGTLQTQLHDGGYCPAKDCVPCSGATVTDLATAGKFRFSGPEIRHAAGISCTSGLTQQQMANGVKNLTGGEVAWTVHYDLNRQQVIDYVRAFGALEISLLYRRILYYSFRNSGQFTGGHGTVIIAVRTTDNPWNLEFLWGDPLADGRDLYDGTHAHTSYQWVRADVILAAAEDRGGGVINVAIPPDSRYATKRTVTSTPLRLAPNATSSVVSTASIGATLRVRRPVKGSVWDVANKTGTGWWEVDQVNGKAVSLRYAAAIRVK